MRGAFVAATLVTALVCAWKNDDKADDASDTQADFGHRVYLSAGCGTCHGVDAHGGRRGPDLTDPEVLKFRRDNDIFTTIKRGRPQTMMPAFDDLDEDDIRSIVSFLRYEGEQRAIPTRGL